jgi:DNA polymerase-4
MPAICRDCLHSFDQARRCPLCHGPRVQSHDELFSLSIAHVDCDSFYASVEKRDNPDLRDQPVIVGGGHRGVVTTCCYIARLSGVRSAMPMFQALRLCPGAVVIAPRMAVYAEVSGRIREKFQALTPMIEPLSLDEAFLDLTGTERLHGAPPAVVLMRLARQIEQEIGVTVSVGLSHNKFLAKIASDLDKPRGFSVIGRADTEAFLRDRKVGVLWGVGLATQQALERAGIRTLADLRRWDRGDLVARFGQGGARLWHLARGEDNRKVNPHEPVKSISRETTFDTDLNDTDLLRAHLWRLAVQVSDRAKAKGLAGGFVQIKLKRGDHRILTRRRSVEPPTQLADTIYRLAVELLDNEGPGAGPYRLIGVGIGDLQTASDDPLGTLLDRQAAQRAAAERASDRLRAKFGKSVIQSGRSLRKLDP